MTVFVLMRTDHVKDYSTVEVYSDRDEAMKEMENKANYQVLIGENLYASKFADRIYVVKVKENYDEFFITFKVTEHEVK